MTALRVNLSLLTSLLAAAAVPAGAATPVTVPDAMAVGLDRDGQPCTVTRDWSRAKGPVKVLAQQPFVVTCRGASAARVVGIVTGPAYRAADSDVRVCGDVQDLAIDQLGPVRVRRCRDAVLGPEVVEVTVPGRKGNVTGTATASALVPMLRSLRAVAGGPVPDAKDGWNPALAWTALPAPAPCATTAADPTCTGLGADANFGLEAALRLGGAAMRRGDNLTASRVLNDALSRVGPETPVAARIELQLSAALADSGLGATDSADAGFKAAGDAMTERGITSGYLQTLRITYAALHALNHRDWRGALEALDGAGPADQPLQSQANLSTLNREVPAKMAESGQLGTRDPAQDKVLVLDFLRSYARSVALLGLGRVAEATVALKGTGRAGDNSALAALKALQANSLPEGLDWFYARMQLQSARIAAAQRDFGPARSAYGCALSTLRGTATAANACDLTPPPGAGAATTAGSTAALELEPAAVSSLAPDADRAAVLRDFREAIAGLKAIGETSTTPPPALMGYLDLLLAQRAAAPSDALDDEYFQALQAVGDPAIAKDIARLESDSSDPAISALLREKSELERRITQLRYQIAASSDSTEREALDQQRSQADRRRDEVSAQLQANPAYRPVDTSIATLQELRDALLPGEVYVKLVKIRTRFFGMAVSKDKTWPYAIKAPAASVENIVQAVLSSARSKTDGTETWIDPFDVRDAHALFRMVMGPAADMIARQAKAVVFDPAGALRNLPAGALVIDPASVKRYAQTSKVSGNDMDFHDVRFLAGRAVVSTATSPRSFLTVRSRVDGSRATRALIGFAHHASVPPLEGPRATQPVLAGFGCSVPFSTWAGVLNANDPISADELTRVATALGHPEARKVTDGDFSDTALLTDAASGELGQYQVLHFATHGAPERIADVDGCKVAVPASLLATMTAPAEGEQPSKLTEDVSNGLLTSAKIARFNLNANLVVLSACQTNAGQSGGLGRLSGQEESSASSLDGLVRAFFAARARAVMATYWRVPNTSRNEAFMEEFYRQGRTRPIGEALQAAQQTMLGDKVYAHPYYWAAYFVVGDAAKPMLSGSLAMAK